MSDTEKPDEEPIGVYKCKEMVHDIFLQSGNKDRLMAHIRHKTAQQGWTWTMRDEFINYIKKNGPDNVNVSHMIADLASLGRQRFPSELKTELIESMFEVSKDYFTIDDTVIPMIDPDNENSEAEKTFLYQSRDIKADPGLGIGIDALESPPPSPESSGNSGVTTPSQSPNQSSTLTSSTNVSNISTPPFQNPAQNNPRQSPGNNSTNAVRLSPGSSSSRPLTPQPLPPPPILRPETESGDMEESVEETEELLEEEELEAEQEEEEDDDDDDDEDVRTNEEDEEELMDV